MSWLARHALEALGPGPEPTSSASPIRTPRGEDIMPACSQLKSATERGRKPKAQIEAEARA
ncbi:MAG: hypothetical protein Q4G26_03240 [Paracoccus sp. (in: a-proteobacteria)]|nr:hypothetical protein [Paracoccus sp. (in: a-proteobacteria)]